MSGFAYSRRARAERDRAGAFLLGLLVFLLILLAGCAVHQPPSLDAAASAESLQKRSLADAGLRSFLEASGVHGDWPRDTWDLESLRLAALYFSPELELALGRLRIARAELRSAGALPNPSLSLTPQFDFSTASPSPWVVASELDFPLPTAGKRAARVDKARRLLEAAALDGESAAWRVRAAVRSAMVETYAAAGRRRLTASRVELARRGLELVAAGEAAGEVSPAAVQQAQLDLDAALLEEQDARRQAAQSRIALAEAIGLSARALRAARLSFAGLEQAPALPEVAAARRRALTRRADIRAALARYAAADAELRLQLARQYPDLHLGPAYEFDQGDNKWGLAVALELPLLNRNHGPIAEAEARREQSAAAFRALQARVLADLERALAAYRSARKARTVAEEMVVHLRDRAASLRGRLQAGDMSRGEFLRARAALLSARLARLQAVVGVQRAFAGLEEALRSELPAAHGADVARKPGANRARSRASKDSSSAGRQRSAARKEKV